MGYVLLWCECLATSVLLVALALAFSARISFDVQELELRANLV